MAKLREMRLYLTGPIIQLSISRPVFDRRRTKKQAFSNVFHRKRLAIYPLRWYNETVSTTEVRHKKLFRCREHRLSWYRPGLPFRAVLCRLLTCYFFINNATIFCIFNSYNFKFAAKARRAEG